MINLLYLPVLHGGSMVRTWPEAIMGGMYNNNKRYGTEILSELRHAS
ncbi:MAG: hypothetical protein ACI3Y5_03155 [Prevotella sp.]